MILWPTHLPTHPSLKSELSKKKTPLGLLLHAYRSSIISIIIKKYLDAMKMNKTIMNLLFLSFQIHSALKEKILIQIIVEI